ncbi:hypothetical protein FOMG_18168 [Fusarium oxysporum f. sp. melonis 26406]|uniref:Uncharacterized protein n=1 Tax=Fusarium oxysporum f. sp. melonis 26406 TaxID=1089452 RepID=W9Z1A1_FUSOX|nr:hypothetical protein FOMG_18168 [Fusarium oxysporum f. sp. melonis 26406]
MAFNLQEFHWPRDIGFRVEVHDNHRLRNCTFDEHGNMIARNPSRLGDAQACRDHLLWQGPGGPFVSFFTNWNAALRRRQWMIEQGAIEVVIVAVWLKELSGTYDAFAIARVLGLEKLDKPDLFLYEVLIHGEISADSYRILAMFPGIQSTVGVALCVPRMNMMVEVPGDFIAGVQVRTLICTRQLPDPTVKLGDEIYIHAGKRDDAKLFPLVLSMANLAYLYESNAAGIVITCPSAGLGWRIEAVVQ